MGINYSERKREIKDRPTRPAEVFTNALDALEKLPVPVLAFIFSCYDN